jgi:Tfp pilus assembly protein PilV
MSGGRAILAVIILAVGFLALSGIKEVHAIRKDEASSRRMQEFNENTARVIDIIEDWRNQRSR